MQDISRIRTVMEQALKTTKVKIYTKRAASVVCAIALAIGVGGCNGGPFPSIEYDYSRLGNTPLDDVIRQDPDKFHGYPQFTNDRLPDDDRLTKNIINLLPQNTSTIKTSDVESLGAHCDENQPTSCEYSCVISYKASSPNPDAPHGPITISYKILFHLNRQPPSVEVFRRRTMLNP